MKRVFISVLVVVFLGVFVKAEFVKADLNEGLVAYYPFNGNADDESGNGNHGIVNGAILTADRSGNANSAYSFDGVDDYIIVSDSASLDLTTYFTFSVWVLIKGANSGYPDQAIISKVGGIYGDNGYQLCLISPEFDNRIALQFNSEGETWPANQLIGEAISMNRWKHIAGVYNHNELRIYLDGILQGSKNVGAKNIVNSQSNLRISGDDNMHAYVNGYIDDVRIYNRALSLSEIQQLYAMSACVCPDSCSQSELDAQYEAGKQYCIDNPEACGISTNAGFSQADIDNAKQEGYDEGYQVGIDTCDNQTIEPDSNCATFNLFTNTLNVPCLDMGEIYWVDMKLEGDHLTINGFGEVE